MVRGDALRQTNPGRSSLALGTHEAPSTFIFHELRCLLLPPPQKSIPSFSFTLLQYG